MNSATILQENEVPLKQQENEIAECTNTIDGAQREQYDRALDDVLDGFQEAQRILNMLKILCVSDTTAGIAPPTRLKLLRTSRHCNRLFTETLQLLQPFSQELQALSNNLPNGEGEKTKVLEESER